MSGFSSIHEVLPVKAAKTLLQVPAPIKIPTKEDLFRPQNAPAIIFVSVLSCVAVICFIFL